MHGWLLDLDQLRGSSSNPDISHRLVRFSLTPGFSPVAAGENDESRFNGFWHGVEAAEAARGSFCRDSPG